METDGQKALAKLVDDVEIEMEQICSAQQFDSSMFPALDKAQRILCELAKVQNSPNEVTPWPSDAVRAITKSRAIAAE